MNGSTWAVQGPSWLIDLVAAPAHLGDRFYTHMAQFCDGLLLSVVLPLALTVLVIATVVTTCLRNHFLRVTDAMAPSRRPKPASGQPAAAPQGPVLTPGRPGPSIDRLPTDAMEVAA
ncbi:MAG: hypothetical protein WCF04_14340 [Candidatus Nanopelagicales bacterium]